MVLVVLIGASGGISGASSVTSSPGPFLSFF